MSWSRRFRMSISDHTTC